METSATIGQLAAATARAQAKFQPLGKDKSANIQSRSGSSYSYDYADLADTFDAVRAALAAESIAVFQPVRLVGEHIVTTTLLVHGDSGEWIREELAMPVADIHDARAVGSASTYAKRYALQSMVGIAPRGEDDDAETARGGDHEMAPPFPRDSPTPVPAQPVRRIGPGSRSCPVCGIDAIIARKVEWGGGWVCYTKKGGCNTKWPPGPHPVDLPPPPTPGIVSMEQAEREADAYFPDEPR